jgi:hypothetical protein
MLPLYSQNSKIKLISGEIKAIHKMNDATPCQRHMGLFKMNIFVIKLMKQKPYKYLILKRSVQNQYYCL